MTTRHPHPADPTPTLPGTAAAGVPGMLALARSLLAGPAHSPQTSRRSQMSDAPVALVAIALAAAGPDAAIAPDAAVRAAARTIPAWRLAAIGIDAALRAGELAGTGPMRAARGLAGRPRRLAALLWIIENTLDEAERDAVWALAPTAAVPARALLTMARAAAN